MSNDPYRHIVGFYDSLFEPMNRGLRSLGCRMLPPQKDMDVLDVGCGTGVHLGLYREAGCRLHGIDTSASMLATARKRLGEAADLRLGSAAAMPYEDGSIDLVICMLVLHEMDPSTRLSVLAETRRVLRDNGHILLIDFHAGPARPLKGWFTKPFVFLSEVLAGRRHFRNYRHFISIGGLPKLIDEARLSVVQKKVVAGGAMALYLVQA